jgi:type IV pilus assembly protein PilB
LVADFVDNVMSYAIKLKATDVHFGYVDERFLIQFRINGLLQIMRRPFRLNMSKPVIGRLKELSGMDCTIDAISQSGGAKVKYKDRSVGLRMEVSPHDIDGRKYEKCIMRILDVD